MKPTGIAVAIGSGLVGVTAVTLIVPFLALGMGGLDDGRAGCPADGTAAPATDGSPEILGVTELTASELTAWWGTTGHGQPTNLALPISDTIALYITEGNAEGVRGDLAFTQAILETGWFTSSDTTINNFAGIAHPDGASSGRTFPDPRTGVRAHTQLLKKFAAGNGVALAHPDVAPQAGAHATSWRDLAGTWASDPSYWDRLQQIHTDVLTAAGRAAPDCPIGPADIMEGADVEGALTKVQGITVHTNIAAQLDALLSAARADGLALTGSGYRSHDRQIELRRQHCGTSDYAIFEMPSSQCSPPTARPGSSLHEQGLAIDFVNCSSHSTACYQWLNGHASSYGFFNLPSEPWHWSIDGR